MLGFTNDFTNSAIYRLNVNYRCANIILEKAGIVISQNSKRFDKKIVGVGDNKGTFGIIPCQDYRDEYAHILDIIKSCESDDIAILLRTNNEASRYADILKSQGIDCIMTERPFNPYATGIYDIFYNYLRLAECDEDNMEVKYLLPIINKPVRYIKRDSIIGTKISFKQMLEYNRNMRNSYFIIKTFEYHMKKLRGMPDLYSKINYIRKGIGIDEYIGGIYNDSSSGMMYIADWIQENSRNFKTVEEMNNHAAHYNENSSLPSNSTLTDLDNGDFKDACETDNRKSLVTKRVSIMTYHASKGLEFEVVILPHLNEGTMPSKKAVGDAIEEERRLLYVAMTRAKKSLYFLYLSSNSKEKYMMSRFLYKIVNKK